MDVLRPAPVPGCILGTTQRMGLPVIGDERGFVLPIAEGAPVVHRQHRVPSYPSSQSEDSQLQPGAVPQRKSHLSLSQDVDAGNKLTLTGVTDV